MSRRRPWARAFGAYGCKVTVCGRSGSSRLYLRWWDHERDNWRWRSLGHADREEGEQQARELAATLLATHEADSKGRLTVADLFAHFECEVVAHEGATMAKEDRRRMALWTRALGAERDVATVDRTALDRFVRARRTGQLEVPGYHLKAKPSDRTIGMDLEFLRRVSNWARSVCRRDGSPLVERNPLTGYAIPTTANPKRPVASYERYLTVRSKADGADPQGLFGPFLDLIEGLGWRVSAVCQLQASDLDLSISDAAPFGRIRKREETDKERVAMWVPMSGSVRAAALTALERNPVAGKAWLFPSPKVSGASWSRYHARALLERAEKLAGLEPLEGGDFHPYRRSWATARKHLPLSDVAHAGGWKRTETLLRCYQRPDDATLYAVVAEERKVRAISGKP